MRRIIFDEDEFDEEFPFSYSLKRFVKENSKYSWWFKDCCLNGDGSYIVTFDSFATPEYSNFLLSVRVDKVDGSYTFKITKEITTLSST